MGRVNQNMTITLKNLHLATEQEVKNLKLRD